MKSEGQSWAVEQLAEIVQITEGVFEIVSLTEPGEAGSPLEAIVSVYCRAYPKKEGGIPFRVRERLRISIASSFPLSRPSVHFTHKNYGNFPHVQWGDSICLYQAPDVEWQPSRGMLGFIRRLDDWLRAGAAAALDPIGLPLHPPIAYTAGSYFNVIPHLDTPQPEQAFWAGYAEITEENDHVAHLGRWVAYSEPAPVGRVASAILLSTGMPHEYPVSVLDLVVALIERGVSLGLLQAIVSLGALRTPHGKPAVFVLGAAMRGIAGGPRLQHLASWRIGADQTDVLRAAAINATPENPVDEQEFRRWAAAARVEWCHVLEDRPEIIERRDSQSPASFWRGRQVSLLGCGAIGSGIATMLARADVAGLRLYDDGVVTPGLLVRQDFSRRHLGYSKVASLKARLRSVNPSVETSAHLADLLVLFNDKEKMAELLTADVIIDATASPAVATALEHHFRLNPKKHPPIVAMTLGHNADVGMVTLSPERAGGVTLHTDRRSKLAFSNSTRGLPFLDEFWPTDPERRKLFQPEPGCSDPTFRGSFADVLALTARMINVAATWLAKDAAKPTERLFAIDLSKTSSAGEVEFKWQPDLVLNDGLHGYSVRVSVPAFAAMLAWTRSTEEESADRTETGGILFGEVDDFLKIAWIDEVSGPPPDSVASPDGFLCGKKGVHELHDQVRARSRGATTFVGMWHTHPEGLPVPSRTDLRAMRRLLSSEDAYLSKRFLMFIVGGSSQRPIVSASVFHRSDYKTRKRAPRKREGS